MSDDAKFTRLQELVLGQFRDMYHVDEEDLSDAQVLEEDPNSYDRDPSEFYEVLQARFAVPPDESNDDFGGYGGSVRDTIAFLLPRWDGEIREVEYY